MVALASADSLAWEEVGAAVLGGDHDIALKNESGRGRF